MGLTSLTDAQRAAKFGTISAAPEPNFVQNWIFDYKKAYNDIQLVNHGIKKPVDVIMEYGYEIEKTALFGKAIGELGNKLKSPAKRLMESISSKIPNTVSTVTNLVQSTTNGLKNLVRSTANRLKPVASNSNPFKILADQGGWIRNPFATRSISPKIKALSEANITDNGVTVLGRFKAPPGQMNYIQKATTGKYKGSSYFDLGDAWTPVEGKAANRHFLDIVGERGDKMIFSTPKNKIPSGTSLEMEVNYLKENFNYKWVNQWSMQKR